MIEVYATPKQRLGMPVARFLDEYWQRKPLLIRSAFAGFRSPVSPEDLAGIACEDGVLSRLIRHDRRRDAWSVRSGPFAESEFPKLPKRDWTLLVQDMDKWDHEVGELLQHFAFLPRWRIDDIMISFAAPGGSVGAHVDQYDVFLLQGMGHRRWQIDASANPPLAFRDDVELKLLREFKPSHDWVLGPGDMLYLPPGVPHHGVAEDACLTFSVGMRAPSQAELLSEWADGMLQSLPEEQRYGDAGMTAASDPAEIDGASADRVLGVFRQHVPDSREAAAAFFGRFITSYRNAQELLPPPRVPAPERVQAQLEKGALLSPHPFSRRAWSREQRSGILYAQGHAFETTKETASLLANARAIDASAYSRLDGDARALLQELIERGVFVLGKVPRK
jgi:50S ribosomal protein L16 3-hydroxylase